MCLAVYLACDTPLQVTAYDKQNRRMYLDVLSQYDRSVAAKFSLPHIYYVGSHEGCGCGFRKGGKVGQDLDDAQRNYDQLVELMRSEMQNGAHFELFICWEGDQGQPAASKRQIQVKELEALDFDFQERELIIVENE